MTYGVGVKELWEVPAGRIAPGEVIYTMGWPLTTQANTAAPGSTAAKTTSSRSASSPGSTIPTRASTRSTCCRTSSSIRSCAGLLEGGKMIRYGAKTLPYGGWWAMPPLAGDGWMILGDSAGFLNSQRLKGIHLAIKSGMLAAETAFEALMARRFFRRATAGRFQQQGGSQLDQSTSSGRCATSTRDSSTASGAGMVHAGLQQITGGRGLRERYPAHAGHQRMKQLWPSCPRTAAPKRICSARPKATAS